MTAQEILYKHLSTVALSNQKAVKTGMLEAMHEYGIQERNKAID